MKLNIPKAWKVEYGLVNLSQNYRFVSTTGGQYDAEPLSWIYNV